VAAHLPRPGPDLRLFEEWMGTTKWLLERTARFPKRVRSSISNRLENLALGILEDVTTAALDPNSSGQAPKRHPVRAPGHGTET